ncbi:hypothetical protein SDC9_89458 [bioreactor metagenome]|uniref:Uncharacterized protein n=1 Tax=bioreactor metagenome TaxID=1076179 RepID=A0A644ZPW4_9ZZZZ
MAENFDDLLALNYFLNITVDCTHHLLLLFKIQRASAADHSRDSEHD